MKNYFPLTSAQAVMNDSCGAARVASCGSKVASCGTKTASCGNKFASCGTKTGSCGSKITTSCGSK